MEIYQHASIFGGFNLECDVIYHLNCLVIRLSGEHVDCVKGREKESKSYICVAKVDINKFYNTLQHYDIHILNIKE